MAERGEQRDHRVHRIDNVVRIVRPDADRARLNGGVAAVLAKPTHDIAELPDGLRSIVESLRRNGQT